MRDGRVAKGLALFGIGLCLAELPAVLGAGALDLLYARRLGARADRYRLTAGQTA